MTRGKAVLYLMIASVLWSTGGLLIKSVPWHPIAIAGVRSGIAGLVILLYWVIRYKHLPPLPNKNVMIGALTYVVLVFLFVSANKMTTAANAILLQFSAPAWVMVLGRVFYGEKIYKSDITTVAIVFIGMSLFFVGDLQTGGTLGNTIAVLSGVAMAVLILRLNKLKTRKPIEIVFWGNVLTFFIAIPFYSSIQWTTASVTGILLLGIFQLGIAYTFYTEGIQHVSALEGILIPVLEPLFNPIWVLIGTGEAPTVYALIGGTIVMGAVIGRQIWVASKA